MQGLASDYSQANAINNQGQVVRVTWLPDRNGHAFLSATLPSAPPTPEDAAEEIAGDVAVLIAGGDINPQDGQGLQSRLDTAVQRFSSGNTTAGVNVLNAFNNKVNALVNSGRLTAGDGRSLIDASNAIINQVRG